MTLINLYDSYSSCSELADDLLGLIAHCVCLLLNTMFLFIIWSLRKRFLKFRRKIHIKTIFDHCLVCVYDTEKERPRKKGTVEIWHFVSRTLYLLPTLCYLYYWLSWIVTYFKVDCGNERRSHSEHRIHTYFHSLSQLDWKKVTQGIICVYSFTGQNYTLYPPHAGF